MKKFLTLTIILVLFLCAGCTTNDNDPLPNQNNLSNIDNESNAVNGDLENDNNDNEITR